VDRSSPAGLGFAHPDDRSPRSKPIVSFCSRKFLICFAAAVLIFFIAGLLYLLRFERVDNLGAYSIPPDTGLLIPSVRVTLPSPWQCLDALTNQTIYEKISLD
jgi:hypothetical protein